MRLQMRNYFEKWNSLHHRGTKGAKEHEASIFGLSVENTE